MCYMYIDCLNVQNINHIITVEHTCMHALVGDLIIVDYYLVTFLNLFIFHL